MRHGVCESLPEEVLMTLVSVIKIPDQNLPVLLPRSNFWRSAVGVKDRLKFNTVIDQFAALSMVHLQLQNLETLERQAFIEYLLIS